MLIEPTPKVAVLLAAYNGEQYIKEQLDSIIEQKNVSVKIIISIDKSSDLTLNIVEEYIDKYPNIVSLLSYGESYCSAGQNFTRLLCDVDFSQYEYISFSDQDDIWLPEKLQRAISILKDSGVDAYSANVTAFWEDGRTALIKKDYAQAEFDYLFESPGPGCTFVFTQKVALSIQQHLLSKKIDLKKLWLHDWYCYSYARHNHFNWYIDSLPLMKYRQHSNNEVGANSGWVSFKSRLKVIISGSGFVKVLAQADFIGQLELEPIKLIKDKTRTSMFKLFLISWKCRRQFSHKMMLSIACLLFSFKGCTYNEVD